MANLYRCGGGNGVPKENTLFAALFVTGTANATPEAQAVNHYVTNDKEGVLFGGFSTNRNVRNISFVIQKKGRYLIRTTKGNRGAARTVTIKQGSTTIGDGKAETCEIDAEAGDKITITMANATSVGATTVIATVSKV